ncbi:MAG TPA: glutamate racemase [Steroidobacteraceae bacterium]|nr:glutamate racemase [Steroidobacteraceae bacterium]
MTQPRSEAPVGVFDSGVGGLTVLQALHAQLPHESFVYLGDTARLPYGTKSLETVERYSLQAAQALAAYDVKCIVVACNTASSVGLAAIGDEIASIPVIGVIEPGAAAAAAASRSGRIGVIGTEGTIRGGAYQRAITRRRPDAIVIAKATPLFVSLAEEGLTAGPIAESIARHYLEPMFAGDAALDTLVLGCTHFPILADTIRAVVGPAMAVIDSAATTAATVKGRLERAGLARRAGAHPTLRFLATDGPERFARIGGSFLQRTIDAAEVELVDL